MGKKLVWFESYKTICKYSTELTDEEAKLFEDRQIRSNRNYRYNRYQIATLKD